MSGVSRWLFHALCFRHATPPHYDDARFWDRFANYDTASTRRFFARFGNRLELRGKSVLDIGCGRGATSVEAARRGARRVVGVDLEIHPQSRQLVSDPELDGRVELLTTEGTLGELGSERFDVILSKDSFEHYADPESLICRFANLLEPDGLLAIGFGPLWKSPQGGHLEFMTPLPWAHLLFPEHVILAERRRFRPDEDARSFAEISGGLNKMTLARFRAIMESSGLQCVFFATNQSNHPVVRMMTVVSTFPPLRELFTTNVYGVWRHPRPSAPRRNPDRIPG
jgi:SAM-dependent methyltransferase